jgi:FkbM family methyltransferase
MLVEYSAGVTEAKVTEAIAAVVQPGWTCLDVGAHKGYFTLLLARVTGEAGRVISFEAHPDNAAATLRHVVVNGVAERVQVINKAVSDGKESEVLLYFGRDSSPFEWNIIGHDVLGHATEAALRVPCLALDDYFTADERIDFVKMDIEGAEGMALAGMHRILEESHPVLLVEFHNQDVWDSRRELIPETYTIYDISKGEVVSREQEEFVHQCLMIPTERESSIEIPYARGQAG